MTDRDTRLKFSVDDSEVRQFQRLIDDPAKKFRDFTGFDPAASTSGGGRSGANPPYFTYNHAAPPLGSLGANGATFTPPSPMLRP